MPDMREKMVELLRSAYGTSFNAPHLSEHELEPLASHLIANGVTVQEWISVKDRLPEGFTSCIVYRKGIYGGHFSMLRYSQELGWHFYDPEWGDVTVNDVTHWMPLPQPPKGE